MPINVSPSDVPDEAPLDSEPKMVVGQLPNGPAAGATGMKAEHLKEWLGDIKREETEDAVDGLGDCCWLFVVCCEWFRSVELYPLR